ncbi:MAG: aspartokinase [Planctomycetota bacterium]|nr:MAG: aspartokinase [Planctomycetota bacterium]
MRVYKFGGSCLTSPASLERVRELVGAAGLPLLCVFSALRGVTDRLLALFERAVATGEVPAEAQALLAEHRAYLEPLPAVRRAPAEAQLAALGAELERTLLGVALLGEPSARARDRALSFGERAAVVLAAALLAEAGLAVEADASADTGLLTDAVHGDARILPDSRPHVLARYRGRRGVVLVPGFIGRSRSGAITTLGRGGSDYTATYLGAVLGATTTLWKDTQGLLTADPRLVAAPRRLTQIHYLDALELAHYGTRAIADRAILPCMQARTPIEIRGFLHPEEVTRIDGREAGVLAVSSVAEAVMVDFLGTGRDMLRTLARLLSALAERNTYPLLVTEASPRGETSIVLKQGDLGLLEQLLEEHQIDEQPLVREDIGLVAMIGSRMRGRVGFAAAIFETLAAHRINILAIAQTASERNVSVILERDRVPEAVAALHERFIERELD